MYPFTTATQLQQIQLLVKNATDGDRFFIYCKSRIFALKFCFWNFHQDSGHGSQVKSLDDNEYDKMDERQYVLIRPNMVPHLSERDCYGWWKVDNR